MTIVGLEEAPLRVVVADDEPDVRMLLRLQLRAAGFEVVGEAADGAEAVRLCEELTPDAIVLDLLMPGVSGFQAIPEIRRVAPDCAIIAYSAVAGDFVRNEMDRLGIPLLLKSGDIEPLAEAIRAATGTHRR